MNIKETVQHLVRKHNTNDPFLLCNDLGIMVTFEPLGSILGYYNINFRIQSIHLNCSADESLYPFICAHELGHAILHPKISTPFLKANTFFSIDKIERQANTFAVELLLSDDFIMEHDDTNLVNLAITVGIPNGLEQLKYIDRINFF